jgi:DNA-binding transcriptional regulator YbjK
MTIAERQQAWRQRRKRLAADMRQQGRQRLEVWVTPTTANRLDKLAGRYGSVDKVIEKAVRELARASQSYSG